MCIARRQCTHTRANQHTRANVHSEKTVYTPASLVCSCVHTRCNKCTNYSALYTRMHKNASDEACTTNVQGLTHVQKTDACLTHLHRTHACPTYVQTQPNAYLTHVQNPAETRFYSLLLLLVNCVHVTSDASLTKAPLFLKWPP